MAYSVGKQGHKAKQQAGRQGKGLFPSRLKPHCDEMGLAAESIERVGRQGSGLAELELGDAWHGGVASSVVMQPRIGLAYARLSTQC